MKDNATCTRVVHWLVLIGALNWGLVGLGALIGNDLNVVALLLGDGSTLESIVYLLIGLAALKAIYMNKK